MTDLALTSHAVMRMAQRGIEYNDLDLIIAIGSEVDDGLLVRKKDVQAVELILRDFLKRLKKIEGKRIVVADGCLVTAFHATDREQRRLMKHFN
ncbi:DUF4258 domain-containing protein [Nostoc sp. CHAB 5834]|nr:DUF4258 domain-containing protein [Nostoc sp. CHAB 5834]